ncbi:MAG: DUF4292 domain-containing protein [Ignavibacteria bacterium]|nr:DUF4292 domain-containing protein [Ignavibacteria bacterium]
MKKYFQLIFLLSGILFYSCTATETEMNTEESFADIKEKVNANSEKLVSLDAYGEISIDSPEMSNTGSITVSIFKPDSIYTKLEGPFGIDVADLLITRNNFIYYNVMDNRVIQGQSTPNNLKIIMNVNVNFDEIINAFSGKFIFKDDIYDDVKITRTEESFIINIKSGNEIKKFWVNSKYYYVSKIGTYDDKGNIKIEIVYENFYEKEGIHFPKKITINRPSEKQNIWLTYNSEEFNNNKLTYKLKIPKSAKKVEWK